MKPDLKKSHHKKIKPSSLPPAKDELNLHFKRSHYIATIMKSGLQNDLPYFLENKPQLIFFF